MNILVVCHFGLYQNIDMSFVHNQVREYAAMGHRVRVIIPVGMGKTGPDGRRLGKSLIRRQKDQVELMYMRYITLSSYGEKHLNNISVRRALAHHAKTVFEDFRPDVIHAHTLGFDSKLGAWIKQRFGCPLIVTTHGSDCAIPLEQGKKEELRQVCNQADRVVAVSSVLAEKVRSTGTDTKVLSVLNGVNLGHCTVCEKKKYSFVQVGHLIPQKKVDVTIRAFARIHGRYPQAELTVIGQGSQRDALMNLCRELKIEDAVRFTGEIPNRKVMEILSCSEFFVMPSVCEGFGIVYLEAMASGCLTIGTQGEGIADLIQSGKNGFLVPADSPDEIVKVIQWAGEHPSEAEEIVRQGEKDAKKLTWTYNAAQYIDIFEQLSVQE